MVRTALVGTLLLASTSVLAGPADEFVGVRSSAMGGAHHGVGTSNDAIYVNPAGMSISRRYTIEANYGLRSFNDVTQLNASAVDSKSGPVAAGLGYTRERGDTSGLDLSINRIYIAVSYALSQAITFGVNGRYLTGSYKPDGVNEEDVSAMTGGLGIMVRLGEMITVGGSYQNFIDTDDQRLAPLTAGFGAALTSNQFVLAADMKILRPDSNNEETHYMLGGEYFLQGIYPIRLGYRSSPFVRGNGEDAREGLFTAGLGWVSQGGALDASYEQSLERGKNKTFIFALRFFL